MKKFLFLGLVSLLFTFTGCKYEADSVEVRPETLIMGVGNTYQMHAKVKPEKASQHVKWSSSDASIAEISNSGLITAKKAGYCEILVYADAIKESCKLTVRNAAGTFDDVQ